MRFKDIKGNQAAVDVLRSMADAGRVPHAMLFHENPASGGMALAVAWIQYLNCEHPVDGDACGECPSCRQMAKLVHPDVHFIFPVNTGDVIKGDHPVSDMALPEFRELFQGNPYFTEQELYSALGVESKSGNISVYEAREILNTLSLSSVQNGYKAVVIFLPERLNAQAANKLLKIVEEPPEKTLFVMVTQSPEDVMTTIYSRCQLLRVIPDAEKEEMAVAPSEEIRELWDSLQDALLKRNLSAALEVADGLTALRSREKQKSFCIFASNQVRRIFMGIQGLDAGMADVSKSFSSRFCVNAASNLDKASMLIGRNVSASMVFTDLVNRLFVNM